jgi:SAM-dependent methyltransferase
MIEIQATTITKAVPMELKFPEAFRCSPHLRLWSPLNSQNLINYADGMEEFLRGAIETAIDLSWASAELAGKSLGWPYDYHLNPVRTAIVQPLTITKEHSVLELGAGCGIITRFLAEKAGKVVAIEGSLERAHVAALRTRDLPNVDVVACNFQDFHCQEKFDIVTLIGVLEYSGKYIAAENPFKAVLEMAKSFLSKEGVIVIAIENKLGLKYFSGAREDHCARLYEGVEGYPSGTAIRTFGKVELQQLLKTAGFNHTNFLYPFPDYKLPSVIIAPDGAKAASDEPYLYQWLSYRNASDYTDLPAYKFFRERLVAKQLESNQLLTDMSNSFLVIASQSANNIAKFVDLQCLVYKYGLRRIHSCMTEVVLKQTENGPVVERKRLFPDSDHMQNGLKLKLKAETQVRSYIKGSTLMERITAAFIQTDVDADPDLALLPLLKKWYQFLQEAVVYNSANDPLLPGLYWDCIPENLIVLSDGSLFYFDQEFEYHELLPMKYVIFRGLLYIYQNSLPFIDQSYAKKKLADKSFRGFFDHILGLLQSQTSDSEYNKFWELEWQCIKKVLLSCDLDLPSFKSLYSPLDPASVTRTIPWLEEQLAQATQQKTIAQEQLKITQAQFAHALEENANSVKTVEFLSSTINNMQQSKFWQLRLLSVKLRKLLQMKAP